MQITIDTGQSSKDELTALIALLASLGGRLPGNVMTVKVDATEAAAAVCEAAAEVRSERPAPPPPSDQNDDDDSGPADGSIDPTKPDSSGVPWDARIHSTPPKINKDGTYRSKRGISEVEFGRIHGELSEQQANPTTGTATSGAASQAGGTADERTAPPPPADGQDAEAPPPPADGPNAGTAESAPTAAGSANAGDASGAAGGRFAGFPAFIGAVNAIRPAPGIPYNELNELAVAVGVPGGFKDMRNHPELWETFFGMAGGQ